MTQASSVGQDYKDDSLNQKTALVFKSTQVGASLVAQEMQVWSLGQEDPLQKEMATYSSILAWETPWIEEPGRLQSMGLQKSWTWLSE